MSGDPIDPAQAVSLLLHLAGLHPSDAEVDAIVQGYAARRAALDAMYVPEAEDESPVPDWLYRSARA
jgi:hypothetical protein